MLPCSIWLSQCRGIGKNAGCIRLVHSSDGGGGRTRAAEDDDGGGHLAGLLSILWESGTSSEVMSQCRTDDGRDSSAVYAGQAVAAEDL